MNFPELKNNLPKNSIRQYCENSPHNVWRIADFADVSAEFDAQTIKPPQSLANGYRLIGFKRPTFVAQLLDALDVAAVVRKEVWLNLFD
jgi:hypothetical protein